MTVTTTAPHDRYPSRVGAAQEITERKDPVLWGPPGAPGPLDRGSLEHFRDHGYVILTGHLDPSTVERCLTEVDRLAHDAATLASERAILEPDSEELRSLFEVHRVSRVFADLASDPRLAGVARQLLDDDVYIHQSRINLKRGMEGRSFPWHSDFETWHVEDGMPAMRAVSCSIALTDNHSWNGPLLLIAGSHRWYVSFGGRTPDNHHEHSLRKQEYGVPDEAALSWLVDRGEVVTFEAPAGSVVFFECNVMHGSPNNISPVPRTNAFFVYNSVANAVIEPFGTERPRPTHIATREVEPLPRR